MSKENIDAVLSAKSLHYFLQLVENMNYTQTSQILGITQPALSQQIKKLERAVGAPLFGQIGKKLYLTEAGFELEQTARKIFDMVSQSIGKIQEYSKTDEGHISIGVLMTLKSNILEKFLVEFNKKYPKITISYSLYNRRDLWHKLEANQLDFAIVYMPEVTGSNEKLLKQYEVHEMVDDELLILTHQDLTAWKEYPITLFKHDKWVAFEKAYYLSSLMDQIFVRETGTALKPIFRFGDAEQLIATAEATNFDTYIARSYYKMHEDRINLTPIRIKGNDSFKVCYMYRRGKLRIPRIANFADAWNKYLDKLIKSSKMKSDK